MILKKGLFSDLEILEICEHVNREEYEEDPPNRIETLNNCNAKYRKLKHHRTQYHKTNVNPRIWNKM